MARQRVYYKGRRKKRNYAIVPFVILLLILSTGIILFYSFQKYAVISDDGIEIRLPILTEKEETTVDASGKEVKVFEYVDPNLQFLPADYTTVEATAGRNLSPVRAIYIPYDEVMDAEKIDQYANRLSSGNALLFELKKEDGYLAYYSECETAYTYGLNMVGEDTKEFLASQVAGLKEKGIYLVAQISTCIDDLFGAHCATVTLKNQFGYDYGDSKGNYRDPYSVQVRNYVVELCEELYDMGFDEVVLANVLCPVIEDENITLVYTREMSTSPTKIGAVSSFVVNVAEALSDRAPGKVLSIYCDSTIARVKADAENGQNGPLFMKVFDRVYLRTDRYAYQYNCQDFENSVVIGNIYDRLVPVVINYLPDNSSWIYIDEETQAD